MSYTEKILESNTLYEGRILTLKKDRVLLPNGKEGMREYTTHSGAVCILPIDESGNVFFVRQYRSACREEILELPAGRMEPGEDPALCGHRELEEETGHTAEMLHSLGKLYPSPGCMNEILYLYYADRLTPTAQHLDEDEFLEVEKMPLEEAVAMVLENKIPDAKTQTALLKYWALKK